MKTDSEIEMEGKTAAVMIEDVPKISFFKRNRHAIWRLVVIATLTLGLGAILLPIAACM